MRTLGSPLPAAIVPLLAVAVAACGGPASSGNAEQYPLVDARIRESARGAPRPHPPAAST